MSPRAPTESDKVQMLIDDSYSDRIIRLLVEEGEWERGSDAEELGSGCHMYTAY